MSSYSSVYQIGAIKIAKIFMPDYLLDANEYYINFKLKGDC